MKSLKEIFISKKLKYRKYIDNNLAPKKFNSGCDIILHEYDSIYEKYLEKFRHKNINFCEIGILCGDKLDLFDEYFDNATFYGYDINIDIIKKYQPEDFFKKINIKKLDSRNPNETKAIKETFDIIIDDGCHKPSSIINTFNNFYEKVNKNGIYFIEDVNKGRLKHVEKFLKDKNIKYTFEIKPNKPCGIIIIQK